MIERQLILIANPGNPADQNYAPTAQTIIDRWEYFFRSKIGGYWQEKEIQKFNGEHTIGIGRMDAIMSQLDLERCQYSMIVFCGHGLRTIDYKDGIQLPIPNWGNLNVYPVDKLMGIPDNGNHPLPHIRRTIIIDSCRGIQPITSHMLFEQREYSSIMELDGEMCMEYYNSIIMSQEPHVELLQSTRPGDPAYTSEVGSKYGDAVFDYVKRNTPLWGANAMTSNDGHCHVTMSEMQSNVQQVLTRQSPQFHSTRPDQDGFPFVAYHTYVPRTFNQIVADIEILDNR